MLKEIQIEKAEGVCVLPNWPTQPWYPTATKLMQSKPILLKLSRQLLHLPLSPSVDHPSATTLLPGLSFITLKIGHQFCPVPLNSFAFIMAAGDMKTVKILSDC